MFRFPFNKILFSHAKTNLYIKSLSNCWQLTGFFLLSSLYPYFKMVLPVDGHRSKVKNTCSYAHNCNEIIYVTICWAKIPKRANILLMKDSLSLCYYNFADHIKTNKLIRFKLTSFYPAWKCNWIYSWVQPSSNLISSCWRWKHLVRSACSCGLRKMKKLIWNFLHLSYFIKS